jgi:hypothetical protein
VFDRYGRHLVDHCPRGAYFTSEHDAHLFALWFVCEEAAKTLRKFHARVRNAKA